MTGRSMRCLHLLPDTADAGAEHQAYYLLRALADNESIAPEIAYFGAGAMHQRFVDLGLPLRHIPRCRRLLLDFRRRAGELRNATERPPEILHTWLPEANIVGLTAARQWPETRVIVTERAGFDRVSALHLRFEALFLGRADHAIANSHAGRELISGLGIAPADVSVIPNGIPPDRVRVRRSRADVRAELGVDEAAPIVAWVGRADPQKDLHCLTEAFHLLRRRLPAARLLLVGPDSRELDDLGVKGLEGVVLPGWRHDAADFMSASDVVAISSWTEGCSNVACEALMLGLPVATTNIGEHAAFARETGGRVVPIRDREALSEALYELITSPPARENVRANAASLLSVDQMVESTLAVYRDIVAAKSRPPIQAQSTCH